MYLKVGTVLECNSIFQNLDGEGYTDMKAQTSMTAPATSDVVWNTIGKEKQKRWFSYVLAK